MLGELPAAPAPLVDSGNLGGGALRALGRKPLMGARTLYLLIEDMESYDPKRVIAGWADAYLYRSDRSRVALATLAADRKFTVGSIQTRDEAVRGRLFFDEPGVAKLHAPNLTLIAAAASDADLDRAIRQGIGHTGKALFVMPSQQYQFLTDGEVAALIEAIRRFPAGGEQTPSLQVGPLGRIGVVTGKFQTAPAQMVAYRAERVPDYGPRLADARHLVETGCTECHGPALRGKEVKPGTVAPDLAVALAYDPAQFRTLLRTGNAVGGRPLTLMADVARNDFHALTDAEIDDIHAYLTTRARNGGAAGAGQAVR
jgi:mono/diheme cytochrome c family protein